MLKHPLGYYSSSQSIVRIKATFKQVGYDVKYE